MNSTVMIGGLEKSGKTSLICSLMQIAQEKGHNFAGFKPFDIGLLKRNALEQKSDGELICQNMSGEPMETLVSPYLAHEEFPAEMSFRRDGVRIDPAFIKERIKILTDLYDSILIELLPSLFTPLSEKMMLGDWAQEAGNRIIWMINPQQNQFNQNLAEIQRLRDLGLKFQLVFNNTSKIKNQDLVFYIWEKIEKFADQEVEGMIPYINNLKGNDSVFNQKLEEHLPKFLDTIFESDDLRKG